MFCSRVLIEAHEYLSAKTQCTISDGILLRTLVRSLMKHKSNNLSDDINRHIQQCFYCLYNHPSKKVCMGTNSVNQIS